MIFTLGLTEGYKNLIAERKEAGEHAWKVGRNSESNYQGGSVWKTYDDAKSYLDLMWCEHEKFSVFGVMADWETQTTPNEEKGATWHDLLVDAILVDLDDAVECSNCNWMGDVAECNPNTLPNLEQIHLCPKCKGRTMKFDPKLTKFEKMTR